LYGRKTIELTGSSATSIEEAVSLAVARAAVTINGIYQVQLTDIIAQVEDGMVARWKVKIKATFQLRTGCTSDSMDSKVREVAPGIYQIYLPLPMRQALSTCTWCVGETSGH